MSKIEIREVRTREDMKAFVAFPRKLYKGNPYFVPQIESEELVTLDSKKNPAFQFCDVIYFLAYKDGEVAGRIAGIINYKSNEVWNQSYARFGWVDFIDDPEVSSALFHAVEAWSRKQGMEIIHGPMGFSDLDHQGLLVHGFDQLGTIATIYNYPYYPKQIEALGYQKDQDWKEYKIYVPKEIPEKHLRIADLVQQKYNLKVRKFSSVKEIMPYIKSIFYTLNKAYAHLYGFSELSTEQIEFYVKTYLPMLRIELVTVITQEPDDKVIGFAISLPNLSRAMQKAKGKLYPMGILHLLKALKSRPKVVDLYLIGILPEYQNKGINALIFRDLIPIFQRLGVEYCESNPELESNQAVQMQWNYFERVHHKTRRAYIKEL